MSNPAGIRNIIKARNKRNKVDKLMAAAIEEELPIGTQITYNHGDYEVWATVICVSGTSERVKVRGESGKEYFLDVSRITGAWREE